MMRIFRFAFVVLSLASVLRLVSSSFAQQTLGTLNGTVTDPSGASVPGATVTVTNPGINLTRTATTQDNGFYQIFNLPIGTYKVSVTRDGFDTTDLPAIDVQEARATTVNVSLKVGQVSTAVTVTATPMLNATDTTNGYTLDSQQIALTPLATGSFTQLAVLSPGVNAELLSGLEHQWRPGQPADLGQRPARYLEYLSGERRRLDQPLQRQDLERLDLAAVQLQHWRRQRVRAARRRVRRQSAAPIRWGPRSMVRTATACLRLRLSFCRSCRVNASMYDAQQGATSGAQIDANTATGYEHLARAGLWDLRQQCAERGAVLLQPAVSACPARGWAHFRSRW